MSDTVYMHLKVAESMCYETFASLFRGKGKAMTYNFRFDHTCYDKDGNDTGQKVDFEVRYSSNKGSRYVKVEWRTLDIYNGCKPSDWQEIANHDSCWYGCWNDIFAYCRKILIDVYYVEGNESWFFNCESMTISDKE